MAQETSRQLHAHASEAAAHPRERRSQLRGLLWLALAVLLFLLWRARPLLLFHAGWWRL